MATEKEIREAYKEQHDELSDRFYKTHEFTKEEFDSQHGQLWTDMEAELIAEGYVSPPESAVDLKAEIEALKDRLTQLENA